jgi:hypothetical protein
LDTFNPAKYAKSIQPWRFVAKNEDGQLLSALLGYRKQLWNMLREEMNHYQNQHFQMGSSLEAKNERTKADGC